MADSEAAHLGLRLRFLQIAHDGIGGRAAELLAEISAGGATHTQHRLRLSHTCRKAAPRRSRQWRMSSVAAPPACRRSSPCRRTRIRRARQWRSRRPQRPSRSDRSGTAQCQQWQNRSLVMTRRDVLPQNWRLHECRLILVRVRDRAPRLGAAQAADPGVTRFWNLTGETITHLNMAPTGTTRWGPDQCRNDPDGTVDFDERLRSTVSRRATTMSGSPTRPAEAAR